jgi:hypothetical protein
MPPASDRVTAEKHRMMASGSRARTIVLVVAINALLTLGLLELALRVQQQLGPLYDLAVRRQSISVGLSDLHNHVPEPGPDIEPSGIHKLDQPNATDCGPNLLFMGDSFMQGLGPVDNVPYYVRRFFQESLHRDFCVFNAGASSYSPSIFVPQAKKLIPLFKPDFVIIDVDETDLWDDAYRYRALVVRDDTGSIAAVRATPLNVWFHEGLERSTAKALYVHRLISKLYFTRIEFPRLYEQYWSGKPGSNLWLSRLPEAEAKQQYGADIAYFRATLEDLTRTVVARLGTSAGLIYIRHPHLEHLQTSGNVFNDIVATTVRETASRYGIRYFDALDDLRTEFGGSPGNYYFEDDMHFNTAGMRAYGNAVARFLAHALPNH